MSVLKIEIPGAVQPQERPYFKRDGKNVKTYDAPKSWDFKDFVKLVALQQQSGLVETEPKKLHADKIYLMTSATMEMTRSECSTQGS